MCLGTVQAVRDTEYRSEVKYFVGRVKKELYL